MNRESHCRESGKAVKSRRLWGEICKIRLLLGGNCGEGNLNRGGKLWINMKTDKRITWSRCPFILTGLESMGENYENNLKICTNILK